MKKILFAFAFASVLWSCKTVNTSSNTAKASKQEVQVTINLNEVKDDKVMVTVQTPKIKADAINFYIPKTVPGTYSTDNYGKYIEDFKAYDAKGNLLTVKKADDNTWSISNAKTLNKITYLVNDTFDTEKGSGFGKTYNGAFPNFQIDYIATTKDFDVINYHISKDKLSDHFPVRSDLRLNFSGQSDDDY